MRVDKRKYIPCFHLQSSCFRLNPYCHFLLHASTTKHETKKKLLRLFSIISILSQAKLPAHFRHLHESVKQSLAVLSGEQRKAGTNETITAIAVAIAVTSVVNADTTILAGTIVCR
eukprot:m.92028 g.92028  ORF g.92028 m.92028 type:complete len:116 (+) comp51153_c1_seq5:109-456(+)